MQKVFLSFSYKIPSQFYNLLFISFLALKSKSNDQMNLINRSTVKKTLSFMKNINDTNIILQLSEYTDYMMNKKASSVI